MCVYTSTSHVSCHKVYGIKITLSLDLMLGDTGPEPATDGSLYEYVEWVHEPVRKILWTSAKRQCCGYGDPNRIISVPLRRMGLESIFLPGRQVAQHKQRTLVRYCEYGTSDVQDTMPPAGDIVHVDKLMPN